MPSPSSSRATEQPVLEGRRLLLRPLGTDDVNERYVGWLNDAAVTRYLDSGYGPVSVDDIRHYLERFRDSTTDLIFAVVERTTGLHIGNVTLNHIDRDAGTADTGLMIGDRSTWGRGYGTEAWGILIAWAFRALGLRHVLAGVCVANVASVRALMKLGFHVDRTEHDRCVVDGERMDALQLVVTRDEFVLPPDAKADVGIR